VKEKQNRKETLSRTEVESWSMEHLCVNCPVSKDIEKRKKEKGEERHRLVEKRPSVEEQEKEAGGRH